MFTRKLIFAYNFCRQAEHTRCIFSAFDQAGLTSASREPSSLRASLACPCPAPRHPAVLGLSTAAHCRQVCWEVAAAGIPHLPDTCHAGWPWGLGMLLTPETGNGRWAVLLLFCRTLPNAPLASPETWGYPWKVQNPEGWAQGCPSLAKQRLGCASRAVSALKLLPPRGNKTRFGGYSYGHAIGIYYWKGKVFAFSVLWQSLLLRLLPSQNQSPKAEKFFMTLILSATYFSICCYTKHAICSYYQGRIKYGN